MAETRYLPGTSAPTAIDTEGAIVPAGNASIAEYARDVYLALPRERQGQQSWEGLRTFAEQGDWQALEAIYNYFTSNSSLTVSDNSSHSSDRHDQYSYDNRSSSLTYSDASQIAYTDDRAWTEHQYSHVDNSELDYYQYSDASQYNYSDDRQWITHDNRSWVTNSDDRQWVDNNYHYAYAPVTHAPTYYVDNSVYLGVNIDGSFNNNGSGNDSSRHSSSKQIQPGGGNTEFDPIKFVCFIFSVGLAAILASGIWENVRSNGTISSPYYSPEVR